MKNRFSGRPLTSVITHVVRDSPSNVGVRDDKPLLAAILLALISFISAVFPSSTIPRYCPSDSLRSAKTLPQGTLRITNSTWSSQNQMEINLQILATLKTQVT